MGGDLEQFRLPSNGQPRPRKSRRLPRHKRQQPFLKGPIPANWLGKAAKLPGKALHVGLAVWFVAGLAKRRRVKLERKALRLFGVDRRHTVYRALERLEAAGLVAVDRGKGRFPQVEINEVMEEDAT